MIEGFVAIVTIVATLAFALLALKPLFVRYAVRGDALEISLGGILPLVQIHRDSVIKTSSVVPLLEAMQRVRPVSRRQVRFELDGFVHPWSRVVAVETSGPVRFWVLSSRCEVLEWVSAARSAAAWSPSKV